MSFRFGDKSEANLVGVHPDLVRIVRLALTITDIDFGVSDGVRTLDEQKILVATGASRTMDSYHLTGDAVDLVPYVGGKWRWEPTLYHQVAQAMHQACSRLHERLVWGRVWDMELEELDPEDLEEERAIYVRRYQRIWGAKKWPLDDGPHYQRVRV